MWQGGGGSEVSLSAAPESLASAGPTVLSQIGQGYQTPACGMTKDACVKGGLSCTEMGWKSGSRATHQDGGLGGSARFRTERLKRDWQLHETGRQDIIATCLRTTLHRMNAAGAHIAADQGLHPEFRQCLIMHRWALEANSKPWDASIRQRHMMFLQSVVEVTASKCEVPSGHLGPHPSQPIGLSRNLQGPAQLKRDRLQDGRQGLAC